MNRGRGTLLALVLVSGAPVVAGWLLIANPQWLPEVQGNHGELIEPVRPMGGIPLAGGKGALAFGSTRGHWTLLLPATRCGPACRKTLWTMRQVRLAAGEDRRRVDRLLLLFGSSSPQLGQLLADEYPGVRVARVAEGDEKRVRSLFATAGGALENTLFVIDPFGNLMMRHRQPIEPDGVLADLKRLLKASENWGNHGRD